MMLPASRGAANSCVTEGTGRGCREQLTPQIQGNQSPFSLKEQLPSTSRHP